MPPFVPRLAAAPAKESARGPVLATLKKAHNLKPEGEPTALEKKATRFGVKPDF